MDKIIKVATFNIVHMADFSNMFDKYLPKGYNPPSKPNLYIDAIKKFNPILLGLTKFIIPPIKKLTTRTLVKLKSWQTE